MENKIKELENIIEARDIEIEDLRKDIAVLSNMNQEKMMEIERLKKLIKEEPNEV